MTKSVRSRCCAEPLVTSLDSLPPFVFCTRCKAKLGEDGLLPSDPPLVDPETGETAPRLSITQAYERARTITTDQFLDAARLSPEKRQTYLYGEWDEYETALATHLEPDDAA